jgi:hypothetical protein
MSEIMDLVVIEKKNAMAVFTNNDQLDPLIEAIEKEARSLVPDVTTKKAATLSHPWLTKWRAQKPTSTTPVKTWSLS